MKPIQGLLLSLAGLFLLSACSKNEETPLFKIAFGSCGHEDHPLPIFDHVVEHQADVFVFLGDNIYGDTYEMDTLKAKYQLLAKHASFQNLKNNIPIIATWDDHDYGWNDSGRHYPFKEASKKIFLDFFEEPADSERRKRAGIYQSYFYEVGEKKVQIIVLDTRTFRDNLKRYNGEKEGERRYFYGLDYIPYSSTDSTLLGTAQWAWLDGELQKEADLRIIASSTQFGIEYNGYEAWANFPHEQKRMLNLIKKNKANGVLFISGDVHYGEISKLEETGLYPIYDITSSGLSSTWHFATPNRHRIEGPIMDNHFGLLTINVEAKNLYVKAAIWDIRKNQRVDYEIPFEEIYF